MLIIQCVTLQALSTRPACDEICHTEEVRYPAHYTGSKLHTLKLYCDQAATLHTSTAHCPYLRTLHMYHRYREYDTTPLESIVKALHCIVRTNIQYLYLEAYDMCDADILALQHTSVQSLILHSAGSKLTNIGILELLPTLLHLHTLKLRYCKGLDTTIILQIPPPRPTLHTLQYLRTYAFSWERNDGTEIVAQVKHLYSHVTSVDIYT